MDTFKQRFPCYSASTLGTGKEFGLDGLQSDLNNEYGVGSVLISDLEAIPSQWHEQLSAEDLAKAQQGCQGHLRNRKIGKAIMAMGDLMQATIEVFELYGTKGPLRHFRFDPITGAPTMAAHLLLHGDKVSPTIGILTAKVRQHYGLLTDEGRPVPGKETHPSENDTSSNTEKSQNDRTKNRSKRSDRLEESSIPPKKRGLVSKVKHARAPRQQQFEVVDEDGSTEKDKKKRHSKRSSQKDKEERRSKRPSEERRSDKTTEIPESGGESLAKHSKKSKDQRPAKKSKGRHGSGKPE